MESQCDYSMYFPAVPLPPRAELAGDPGRYRALPRRNHLYLGETVRFLLVLRCRGSAGSGAGGGPGLGSRGAWTELATTLAALASVSAGGGASGGGGTGDQDHEPPGGGDPGGGGLFRGCSPLLTHGPGPATSGGATTLPVEEPIVSTDEVIFPLTVSLDRLPPGTPKAKIVVTVWKREVEAPEVRDQGYLRLLQTRSPGETFRGEQSAFKAQVSTLLTLLPPPVLKCRQFTVAGKHLTVLKVLNSSSQEEISIWDIRILPNFNASYLPVMPDGSVLLVDNVCHQSGEVSMGSFCRLPGTSGCFPCPLSALEEHNFLFQLRGGEQPPPGAKEGLEVPLIAVVQWSTPKLPFTQSIYTHYRLPSIRLDRPCFVMTASCESPVQTYERFTVTYTLLNNLQDFLAVRLVWTPEHAQAGKQLCEEERRAMQAALDSIVCHTPLNNLGFSRKGSALTFSVAFQALRTGLFELSQHMKLKLQFTASVSHPPPEARPLSRKSSPSSPAVRDLVERHQASLGRSQSFSHQQPSRSHLMRSGSVMERRAITPPVASPVGRPLYLPPDKAVLSLDKIAKRECKVLVVEPVK
ncbi:trafficking protein particle complex subunit 14 [Loxodonta africana]|uniref:Trafficking protein particle complex subunit 14 n=1 Tax=Loxodonta africana TaxID=9785 RepID=G3T1X3_LOXAF|nr:trafficking protein particle complex subunit 14 [Elephas maximus indicus]